MTSETIYQYTRSQAIADGILIDVTNVAREAGFRIPVAVTQQVWSDITTKIPAAQDAMGRLWDILTVCNYNIQRMPRSYTDVDTMNFTLIMTRGRRKYYDLKAVIGPGDTSAPVLTIMLPNED